MSLNFPTDRPRRARRRAAPPTYTLRVARPDDAAAMQRLVDRLSPASGRQRLHAGVARCSAVWADRPVASDCVHHTVVVAVKTNSCEAPGEARWVRDAAAPAQAELAIAVADAWHGHGLADAWMAELLAAAGAAEISHLVADVLHDNKRVRGLLHRHGFAYAANTDDGLRLRCGLGPRDDPAGPLRHAGRQPAPHRASRIEGDLLGALGTVWAMAWPVFRQRGFLIAPGRPS